MADKKYKSCTGQQTLMMGRNRLVFVLMAAEAAAAIVAVVQWPTFKNVLFFMYKS
jgi:type IV secretory pathway TrbD component